MVWTTYWLKGTILESYLQQYQMLKQDFFGRLRVNSQPTTRRQHVFGWQIRETILRSTSTTARPMIVTDSWRTVVRKDSGIVKRQLILEGIGAWLKNTRERVWLQHWTQSVTSPRWIDSTRAGYVMSTSSVYQGPEAATIGHNLEKNSNVHLWGL